MRLGSADRSVALVLVGLLFPLGCGGSSSSDPVATCDDPFAQISVVAPVGIVSDGDRVYVADELGGGETDADTRIYAVALGGGDVEEIAAGLEVTALAADASGLYYLALAESSFEVRHYDPQSRETRVVALVVNRATAVALDTDHVYVAGFSGVGGTVVEFFRIPKTLTDGLPSEYEKVASGSGSGPPFALAVGKSLAVWSVLPQVPNSADRRVWRADLMGSNGISFVGEGRGDVLGNALGAQGDTGYAVVTQEFNTSELWRFSLDDSDPTVVAGGLGLVEQLLTDDSHVYLVNFSGIQRVPLDGTAPSSFASCGGRLATQTVDQIIVGSETGDGMLVMRALGK